MKTKPRAIRFSEKEESRIERYAQDNGMTFSDVIRQAADSFLSSASSEHLSLSSVGARSSEEDPDLLYGQFLDDFAHARNKKELIAEEPFWGGSDQEFWPYVLAATAHKLAHDNSLPIPRQVLSERFVSPEPIYGMQAGSQELRTYLERTTPMEFRCHNVFLGDNALSRA